MLSQQEVAGRTPVVGATGTEETDRYGCIRSACACGAGVIQSEVIHRRREKRAAFGDSRRGRSSDWPRRAAPGNLRQTVVSTDTACGLPRTKRQRLVRERTRRLRILRTPQHRQQASAQKNSGEAVASRSFFLTEMQLPDGDRTAGAFTRASAAVDAFVGIHFRRAVHGDRSDRTGRRAHAAARAGRFVNFRSHGSLLLA